LGLIHGHWDVKESDINSADLQHDAKRGVNMGISVVVPAHKLLEVINHPELVAMRKVADYEFLENARPKPDTGVK
jgi:hypothetical protein